MPYRAYRRAEDYVGRHSSQVILLLLVALVIALIFAVSGYNKARNVEQDLQAEKLGKAIADVTTCFNRANARPQLVRVLRALANAVDDQADRLDVHDFVDQYEEETPTREECAATAVEMGIDPAPYLENPPSEAGYGR
jgi:uncharacterized protein HemX